MKRLLRWLPLLLAGILTSCGDDDDEIPVVAASCWCVPKVQDIVIVPGSFDVQPGSTFELRTRLYDAAGEEIPEFYSYTPHWTVTNANVKVLRLEGHKVVLEVPSDIGADVTNFSVIAEADVSPSAVSDPAKGRVVHGAPSEDHIIADRLVPDGLGNARPLSVVLATESLNWNVTPVAFSGYAVLGDLRANGEIMVLSPDHAMAYSSVPWSVPPLPDFFRFKPGPDVAAAAQQDPKPILEKDVRIWIDVLAADDHWPATTSEAIARIQLADANRTFARNRVGVQFKLKAINRITAGTPAAFNCFWGAMVQGESLGGAGPAIFDPANNTINDIDVFVIDMEGGGGRSCVESDLNPGYRIYLDASLTVPRVFGHELGHILLGLNNAVEHGDAEDIGSSNLLIEGCIDIHCELAPMRTQLSIGQACEMNRSAVIGALRATAGLTLVRACPPIKKDIP